MDVCQDLRMQLGAARSWHNDDDRLAFIHQCDRPVLELAGRKTLCVDIADLLKFECALKCDGVTHVPPQVDHRGRILHGAGELANALSAIQNLLNRLGKARQFLHVVSDFVGVLVPANLRQIQAEDVARRYLRCESLR